MLSLALRRGETHVEHYGVRERERQWRSRRSKRDIPNVFHVALKTIRAHYTRRTHPLTNTSVAVDGQHNNSFIMRFSDFPRL